MQREENKILIYVECLCCWLLLQDRFLCVVYDQKTSHGHDMV